MSASTSIRTYSDEALNGAIRQLSLGHDWWQRLNLLLKEKQRRQRHGIRIPQSELLFP
jgi:hypothetical protein